MEHTSLTNQVKEMGAQVGAILASQDIEELPIEQKALVVRLRSELTDARLDTQVYEYAETRAAQLAAGKAARERLNHVRELIVKASENNLFSAIDVAQIVATIEQTITRIV